MSASVSSARIGVWLIGARGSVATTVVTGCAAVTAGLQPPTGLATPAFTDSGLPPLSSLVFDGHDTGPLTELGFYFKDPVGDGAAALSEQYTALTGFAARLGRSDKEADERSGRCDRAGRDVEAR